jgi:hypothetical protein
MAPFKNKRQCWGLCRMCTQDDGNAEDSANPVGPLGVVDNGSCECAPRNQRRWINRLIYGSSSNPRNDEEDGKHIVTISDIVCGTASRRTNRRQLGSLGVRGSNTWCPSRPDEGPLSRHRDRRDRLRSFPQSQTSDYPAISLCKGIS